MNKLNKEELLQKWARECSYNHDCHDCKYAPECGQAYQQIKDLIQKPGVDFEKLEMFVIKIIPAIGKHYENVKGKDVFVSALVSAVVGDIRKFLKEAGVEVNK